MKPIATLFDLHHLRERSQSLFEIVSDIANRQTRLPSPSPAFGSDIYITRQRTALLFDHHELPEQNCSSATSHTYLSRAAPCVSPNSHNAFSTPPITTPSLPRATTESTPSSSAQVERGWHLNSLDIHLRLHNTPSSVSTITPATRSASRHSGMMHPKQSPIMNAVRQQASACKQGVAACATKHNDLTWQPCDAQAHRRHLYINKMECVRYGNRLSELGYFYAHDILACNPWNSV